MVTRAQLIIATLMLTALQPALAQGMQAGAMQTMTPSSAIGPEQDSLLPPEVVPMDPATASQMQSRQTGSSAGQSNPMELRRQALGQLMGSDTTIPPAAMKKPWRAGLQAQAPQLTGNMPQASGSVPGLTPGNNNVPQSQLGAPNFQMANNQSSESPSYSAQTQTLTGSSQNQPQQINTRRGGFSNMFSAATTTGLGAIANPFMSGLMMAGPFLRF